MSFETSPTLPQSANRSRKPSGSGAVRSKTAQGPESSALSPLHTHRSRKTWELKSSQRNSQLDKFVESGETISLPSKTAASGVILSSASAEPVGLPTADPAATPPPSPPLRACLTGALRLRCMRGPAVIAPVDASNVHVHVTVVSQAKQVQRQPAPPPALRASSDHGDGVANLLRQSPRALSAKVAPAPLIDYSYSR